MISPAVGPLTFNRQRFIDCLDATAGQLEGKKSHDQNDWGGKTAAGGLTQTVYDEYRSRKGWAPRDVDLADREEAVEIFRWGYWIPARCGELAPAADFILFQWAVNRGPVGAVKDTQWALGLPVQDGSFGPRTMAAALAYSPTDLAGKILDGQITRYQFVVSRANQGIRLWEASSPDFQRIQFPNGKPRDQRGFAVGWINRADKAATIAGLSWRTPGAVRIWADRMDRDFEAGVFPASI